PIGPHLRTRAAEDSRVAADRPRFPTCMSHSHGCCEAAAGAAGYEHFRRVQLALEHPCPAFHPDGRLTTTRPGRDPDMPAALASFRICDFTGQLAGAGATKWLAAFGA